MAFVGRPGSKALFFLTSTRATSIPEMAVHEAAQTVGAEGDDGSHEDPATQDAPDRRDRAGD
jgi:hypothetical protein